MTRPHYILVGRTSDAIASGILNRFGHESELKITSPTNVFQSYFGNVGHEAIFELFVEGKQPSHPIEQNFSESEKAELQKNLNGAHVTIVHAISGENTSGRAYSLLDGVADLKRKYGVASITLEAPHLPFMRNDRDFHRIISEERVHQRNSIACDHYARRLKQEGVDKIVSFEAHSQDGINFYNGYFGTNNTLFHPMHDFVAQAFIESHGAIDIAGDWALACGAPDGLNKPYDLGIARAKLVGLALYANSQFGNFTTESLIKDISWMFGIHKERINPRETKIMEFIGNVFGHDTLLIDDIYASGGTTIQGGQYLRNEGAARVFSYATHGVLDDGAIERFANSDVIDEIILSDTIPGAVDKLKELDLLTGSKFRVKTVAPMVINDIEQDHAVRNFHWPVALKL